MDTNSRAVPKVFVPCVSSDGSPLVPGGHVFSIGWNRFKGQPVFLFNPSTLDAAGMALEWLFENVTGHVSLDSDDFCNSLRSVLVNDCDVSPERSRDAVINCTTYVESIHNAYFSIDGFARVPGGDSDGF